MAAVKFNTVYLPPCTAVALAGFGSASDKRSSFLGVINNRFSRRHPMTTIPDWLSVAAAVVSAVGGAFAARAAFLSARSAREAQQAADAAERRASLRDIANAAAAILVEEKRVSALVDQVKQTHRALSTLSGASRSSRLDLYVDAAELKRTEARSLAEDATLFAEGANSLIGATPEDIDRVQLRQASSLKKVHALREDLEREHDSVEAQCAQIRDSMDRTRLAR